ncbi:MAG: SHOCT domain-containing protein [Desulfomonilaceae bacterium]
MAERKTLPAKQVLTDIRSGMSDSELMNKYLLSGKGLESLLNKMVVAGLLKQSELEARSTLFEGTVDIDEALSEKQSVSAAESSQTSLQQFAQKLNIPLEDLEKLRTSSVREIKDFLEKHNISLSEGKVLLKEFGIRASEMLSGVVKEVQSDRFQDPKTWGPLANPYVGYGMVALTIFLGLIWTPYVSYIGFGVWVLIDAGKRKSDKSLWWGIGTAALGPLVLPVYLSKRPLLAEEVREGGAAWNILKNFALFWTVTMAIFAIYLLLSVGGAKELDSDAAKGIAATVGLGLIGALWFFPMATAMILGFFLKKSSIIERGPTGPRESFESTKEGTPIVSAGDDQVGGKTQSGYPSRDSSTLGKLKDLFDAGVLSEAEFEKKKAELTIPIKIRKLKEAFDSGILNEAEFERKKAELIVE